MALGVCPVRWFFRPPTEAQYSGGTGEPNDAYQIATAADLIALGETPDDYDKHFILTGDSNLDPNLPGRRVFDRAVIASSDVNDVTGWRYGGTSFTGVFDGNGHTISLLRIEGDGYLGLFGRSASGAEVKNLGVLAVNITGSGDCVGGLIGFSHGLNTVTQCYSTATVNGSDYVGGLVGQNAGAVIHCDSSGAVTGLGDYIGGLVGAGGYGDSRILVPGTVTLSFSVFLGHPDVRSGQKRRGYW